MSMSAIAHSIRTLVLSFPTESTVVGGAPALGQRVFVVIVAYRVGVGRDGRGARTWVEGLGQGSRRSRDGLVDYWFLHLAAFGGAEI